MVAVSGVIKAAGRREWSRVIRPLQALLVVFTLSAASLRVSGRPAQPQVDPKAKDDAITCRAMEVFVAEHSGATAVIFHQRDKADGPRVGEFILAHSGEEAEFETADGQRHHATVFRVKSCFGRGLLLFPSSEGKLAENDDFVLRVPEKN